MNPNETEILLLREMVEESVSRKMKTPADFQFLTGVIQERCKETLGVTTLKRIWGYVDGYDTTRYSTLSILARCVGFRDWDDFVANHSRSGEWGFLLNTGKAVMPLDYENVTPTDSVNLFIVKKDGKYGFIDKTGKVVVPLEYDKASNFSEGLAIVSKDGKWRFIDKNGKVLVSLE